MKINKWFKYLLFLSFSMILNSCASKPKYSGTGDLCGYVVDENNKPLEEYIISCKENGGTWKTTITNKNGLFIFEDIALGNCWFKGRKNAYVELDKNVQIFGNKSKVICFQVISIDKALDKVEEMILYEDFDGAKALLKKITCDKKSPAAEVRKFYKDYVNAKKKISELEGDKNEKI